MRDFQLLRSEEELQEVIEEEIGRKFTYNEGVGFRSNNQFWLWLIGRVGEPLNEDDAKKASTYLRKIINSLVDAEPTKYSHGRRSEDDAPENFVYIATIEERKVQEALCTYIESQVNRIDKATFRL